MPRRIRLRPTAVYTPPNFGAISGAYVVEGEKILREDVRATSGTGIAPATASLTTNQVYNGTTVNVQAAKNGFAHFQVVAESSIGASGVTVELSDLVGPSGYTLGNGATRTGNDLFKWDIGGTKYHKEVTYAWYNVIDGISSNFGYEIDQDERHVPMKMRAPFTVTGDRARPTSLGSSWTQRPGADRNFPDGLIYQELTPTGVAIPSGRSQSWFVDVYVPADAPAGTYTGTVSINVGGATAWSKPVSLLVRDITLPDQPTFKYAAIYLYNQNRRRYGGESIGYDGSQRTRLQRVRDNTFRVMWRHKIQLNDTDQAHDDDVSTHFQPSSYWTAKLNGTEFSAANGYYGPGKDTGIRMFIQFPYGIINNSAAFWPERTTQSGFESIMDGWESYWSANYPTIKRCVYITDEPGNNDPAWAPLANPIAWTASSTGAGSAAKAMVTTYVPEVNTRNTGVKVASQWSNTGLDPATSASEISTFLARPGRELWLYNGRRPWMPCFNVEEDLIGPTLMFWIFWKYRSTVSAAWYFLINQYYDQLFGLNDTNVWTTHYTAGDDVRQSFNADWGSNQYARTSGDGMLVLPGTDALYPSYSFGIEGPLPTLRLKALRRGLEDYELLTQAHARNASATNAVVASVLTGNQLWEMGDLGGYWYGPLQWVENPDTVEAARRSLANIIETGSP